MKSRYTQDVEFSSAFSSLQTPVHLYTAGLLCGFNAPAVNGRFRYLDLACGNGHTLLLLADAYPLAEFVGIDINAAHIVDAKNRTDRAGLRNLSFVQADIADLDAGDFEPFDYCAVSGVYSWLDAGRRSKLRDFISATITPGGLLYLDYSAQPGMAQTAPLYQILQQLGAAQSGNSAEKLSAATKILDNLRQNGAGFFQQNPTANDRLIGILNNPPKDEAHEVFNLQASGFWSAEVIQDMQLQGFSYVGSSGLQHNMSAFTQHSRLPEPCNQLPLPLRQLLQDVAWNVGQRKDLYIRTDDDSKNDHDIDNDHQSSDDLLATLAQAPVYLAPGALSEENRRRVAKGYPGVDFCTAVAEKVVESLATAKTFGDIAGHLQAFGVSASEVLPVVANMLSARLLSIAIKAVPDPGQGDELTMPSALNRSILTEDIGFENARPFASPVVGSKVALPIRDRLYLWLLIKGDVGRAWDHMGELRAAFRGARGESLDRSGFVQVLNAGLENFKKAAVPELLRLGILKSS